MEHDNKPIRLILIQISEAHTIEWPLGFDTHPTSQKSFDDRVERAKLFSNKYPMFEIYVDGWTNDFENTFQAWPDKYYLIDKDKKVLDYSKYNMNACIINDYYDKYLNQTFN